MARSLGRARKLFPKTTSLSKKRTISNYKFGRFWKCLKSKSILLFQHLQDCHFLPRLSSPLSHRRSSRRCCLRFSEDHLDLSRQRRYDRSRCKRSNSNLSPWICFQFCSGSIYIHIVSMRKLNESPGGFWDIVARKAKIILEDDDLQQHPESSEAVHRQENNFTTGQKGGAQLPETKNYRKPDKPVLRKGIGALASSLNYIGNALEEGLNIVEHKAVDIIQETRNRRSQFRRKAASDLSKHPTNAGHIREPSATQNPSHTWKKVASDLSKQPMNAGYAREPPATENQTNPVAQSELDIQLQASRNVAMAMAAKTKLLLRELKTVKADLAFAKERCAQLEEENRIVRESLEKGDNPEDDELIRLQLETLLTEKARLAQENAFYARENRFLREIVEYHQLTMQDVVYLNERKEEITEVYPPRVPSLTNLDMLDDTMPPLSSSLHPHPHPPEIVKKT